MVEFITIFNVDKDKQKVCEWKISLKKSNYARIKLTLSSLTRENKKAGMKSSLLSNSYWNDFIYFLILS
jgi:hypothetical protein